MHQNTILQALCKRAADERTSTERHRGWKVAEDVIAIVDL